MLGLFLAVVATAGAQAPDQAEPELRAARVPSGEIQLDGRLTEAAWATAPVADGFRQREPQQGAPATEATEVRVLFDDQTLYVGVTARDCEPMKVISRILERDQVMTPQGFDQSYGFAGDDAIAILLDPFHDRRNAVVFATNPNGAEFDALITDESAAMNADWRGVWSVGAARDEQGWSAEFAIPFRTLRYPEPREPRAWGFNVYRVIRRKNEETLWRSWQRDGGGFHRVSRAGELTGLSGLPRHGLNIEVKPFALQGFDQKADEAVDTPLKTDFRIDAGFDAKWEVRPGLVLDATVNPDFAQVEADDLQVNLTRFELFFPEKRDFFLENAGIFDFGVRGLGETPPFQAFFSRRIGFAEGDDDTENREVPVLGGVRLSGRAGRQTLGFLDMVTGPDNGIGRVNHSVFRVKRDIGRSDYVGAILTDRRGGDSSNTLFGADASFWPTAALNLQGFVAATRTSGPGGDDTAWRVAAEYSGDRYGLVAQHLFIGADVDAQMGFVTRTDIRRSDLIGRRTIRTNWAGLRKIDLFAAGQHITRVNGELQDWSVGPFVGLEWESGERFDIFAGKGFTRLNEGFDLSDRIPVPPGDYDVKMLVLEGGTSAKRVISVSGGGQLMEIYGGHVQTYGGGLVVAGGSHLSLKLQLNRNHADLLNGSFVGDIWSARAGWAFSTRLSARAFVQYDSLDRTWIGNLRLGFIHRPGSDLYVVYNEERDRRQQRSGVTNRTVAIKLTWLARF